MRRRAIVFHGTGADPGACWYGWLAGRLRERGWEVEVPHHPGTNIEPVATFLPRVLAAHAFDGRTVLVGHSGGAALLLALLEELGRRGVTVAHAVLVAGYHRPPGAEEEPVLRPGYDWDLVRGAARELTFVNSVRDPYGCDAQQGLEMLEHLGGTLVVRPSGHFGDADDPCPQLPLLERLVT
ncbi:alpha/beta hydrolase [Kineococcus indalonis]|uniref:alpha/beta hydrolase n=1 Tax=Kineococcus indalonis TaxID=2696566 RepID=UPI0014135565|nr:alpha/beta hydrolase [Kineococcus indalonis]NAZ85988.1 alpha/beta hydrolase [Kineococcus indalonis]